MKKIFELCVFVILVALAVLACRPNEPVIDASKSVRVVDSTVVWISQVKSRIFIFRTPILSSIDTLAIGKEIFIVTKHESRAEYDVDLIILNAHRDTVFVHKCVYADNFTLKDFDHDGQTDIILDNLGSGLSELIIYDRKNRKFRAVKDFHKYPEYVKINNSKYWYSYHKSGCADGNWDSDLFYIQNYSAIKVGNIQGLGCGDKTGIFIYKYKEDRKTLVKEILREPGYYADKWDFIEEYWNKNYTNFE